MGLKIAIDVGGTFTDFILFDGDGELRIHKALSTSEDPSIAVVAGLHEIADQPAPGGCQLAAVYGRYREPVLF